MLIALCAALALQLEPSTGSNEVADDLSRRITPEVLVARQARPAVVFIEAEVVQRQQTIFGPREQKGLSTGSGVVIYEDGWVVTNYHVVRDHTSIRVSFESAPGEEPIVFPARLVNSVQEEDLALLKIEAPPETVFKTVPLGTSSDLMIAEPVIAIGNPYGQSLTVSRGIISGLHRDIPSVQGLRFANLIQTDASINPGNSGGPLLNINGQLIGINTVMNAQAENIGFAIPVDRVRQVLEESLLAPSRAASWYGFEVDPQPVDAAFRVVSVLPGAPADTAGLRIGDLVMGWDGKRFVTSDAYKFARAELEPGRAVRFEIRRDRETESVEIVGWKRSDGLLFERAGFRGETVVATDTRGFGRKLLTQVVELRRGGPAERLGLAPGDLIEAFKAKDRSVLVPDSLDLLALYVNNLAPGTPLVMDVWRDENGNGVLDYTQAASELLKGTLVLE
jgi:S1-C subfamily serine protease